MPPAHTLPTTFWRLTMDKRKSRAVSAVLLLCLFLGACDRAETPSDPSTSEAIVSQSEPPTSSAVQPTAPPRSAGPSSNAYLNTLIANTIAKFATPDMTEYEKAKAAFDYMIANTILDEPIGLDLWRIHEGGEVPLSFVENRSLSVLQCGVGMCEDYAAAFTMLLRGLGLEAQYVPGLTYSLEGHLVDHAWVVAKVDGIWYHLDCQLEDNISRHGAIRYSYFMKSDATMASSHRWGQNLIAAAVLTPEQNAEIETNFRMEACPQDYPSPARYRFDEAPAPDIPALTANAAAELAAYERENGALPPIELNIIPPVFGVSGYGPPDEG